MADDRRQARYSVVSWQGTLVLAAASMCAGGVLVAAALAVWLIRNNPMR